MHTCCLRAVSASLYCYNQVQLSNWGRALVLAIACTAAFALSAYSQGLEGATGADLAPQTGTDAGPPAAQSQSDDSQQSGRLSPMIQGGVEQRSVLQPPPQYTPPALGSMQPQFAPPMQPGYGVAVPPLQGQVQQNYAMQPPDLLRQAALMQNNPFMPAWLPAYAKALSDAMPRQAPLQGEVEQVAERPNWIPAYAYSNSAMVSEYHNMDIMWGDKRPIPAHPQWMKLSPSVIRYWNGYKEDPYWVRTIPDEQHPGNFIFSSNYKGGPKGWLQFLDKPGKWGFPQYRYWFDPQ
jgi:hypothetical protein